MLRALENEIIRQTNASVVNIPDYDNNILLKKSAHGMRLDKVRTVLPKKPLQVDADVVWFILMGPENHVLDLFSQWDIKAKHRIVYIFDTLPPQFNLVKRLYSNDQFNIRITSFPDAVEDLESITGKKWFAIEQAVPEDLFVPVPFEKKVIHFSSYGRKLPVFHDILLEFCKKNNLYYDFTTHDAKHPTAPEEDLYRQYAWHMSHSLFTVSWPVELTNPKRAGNLHPVTCRWFEAAAAGTCIIGQKPGNNTFDEMLHPDIVIDIDPFSAPAEITKRLEFIWSAREQMAEKARRIQESNTGKWTWTERVHRMMQILDKSRHSDLKTFQP
jgi:hypothetical protein